MAPVVRQSISRLLLHWRAALAGMLLVGGVGALIANGSFSQRGPASTEARAPASASPDLSPDTTETPVHPPGTVEIGDFTGIAQTPPAPERTWPAEYKVVEGDELREIAERFRLRTETLIWANELEDGDLILVGQALLIPPTDGVYYTVQPDESLTEIVARYGVEQARVAQMNPLATLDRLTAGVDIFLPGARPIRATSTAPDSVVRPGAPSEGEQLAAGRLPPIPLPDNLADLLTAGWLRADQTAALYKDPGAQSVVLHPVPEGARLERLEGFQEGRIQVRDPGDGKTRQAMTGWINAIDVGMGRAPAPWELPLSYPVSTAMDIAHKFAPYRTQLDGSAYAEANCGPTTIGMALDAFGVSVSSRQLRSEVLNAQRIWGNNVGSLITALADVVQSHGLRTHDLHARSGGIYRWTLDDVREHLELGHPVVVQVRYRALPGRSGAAYYGDHYILLTGVAPGGFLYNDSINHDGAGWDRFLAADRLRTAMDTSDRRYAYAAFAVSR